MTSPAPVQHGSASIPEGPESEHAIPPTSHDDMEQMLQTLDAHKDEWVQLSIDERIDMLERLIDSTLAVSERWVAAANKAKGIRLGTPTAGEEWMAGPAVLARNLRLLATSLRDIKRHGVPQLPGDVTTRPDGQVVANVFPTDSWDKVMFPGFTAEIWMDPSVTPSTLAETQAGFYKHPPTQGKVSLVLGAGNVSSIGPMDVLYKLFVEGQVCVMKMNPVNEYLGPFINEAFAELADRGFFGLVYGGGLEGAYLCEHALVEEIHITGSDKTHDIIVWGPGEEGEKRRARREPRNTRRITSELGNVSPMIVVPGPWSASDIDYQGVNIASSLTNNGGFNCNATRVVVQHAAWNQRVALTDGIKRALRDAEPRVPYYPGAEQRHDAFLEHHPDAHQFGPDGEGCVPWTFITDVDPNASDDICFTTEAFCGVTCETALPGGSVVEYIQRAVDFCNNTLWGTLNAAIIVHPDSLKDPEIAAAIDQAIADLRYGAIGVNHWPALAYALVSTTWGAYPEHELHDVGSGIGVVHNTYLFDKPQKSVVRGPFKMIPKPAWFNNNKTTHEIGKKLTAFNGRPGAGKVPGLLWSAMRG